MLYAALMPAASRLSEPMMKKRMATLNAASVTVNALASRMNNVAVVRRKSGTRYVSKACSMFTDQLTTHLHWKRTYLNFCMAAKIVRREDRHHYLFFEAFVVAPERATYLQTERKIGHVVWIWRE